MREIAFIHVHKFDDGKPAQPVYGGSVGEVAHLIDATLADFLRKHEVYWEDAYEMIATTFRQQEPTRQTIWRWVRNVGRCGLYALAAVGLFALGYWLRMRAGV